MGQTPMGESGGNDFDAVLDFWFGKLDERGLADTAHTDAWFKKDPAFDERIRSEFLGVYEEVVRGARDTWLVTPRSRLALIIVLDQFSRNMFRDSPQMFASDPKACSVAESGIDEGMDRGLQVDERCFFYMPLMHSESLVTQERCIEKFASLSAELTGSLQERGEMSLGFARRHRDIIQRFGRFPHRNQILGRESTPEELEFLKDPRSSF